MNSGPSAIRNCILKGETTPLTLRNKKSSCMHHGNVHHLVLVQVYIRSVLSETMNSKNQDSLSALRAERMLTYEKSQHPRYLCLITHHPRTVRCAPSFRHLVELTCRYLTLRTCSCHNSCSSPPTQDESPTEGDNSEFFLQSFFYDPIAI